MGKQTKKKEMKESTQKIEKGEKKVENYLRVEEWRKAGRKRKENNVEKEDRKNGTNKEVYTRTGGG